MSGTVLGARNVETEKTELPHPIPTHMAGTVVAVCTSPTHTMAKQVQDQISVLVGLGVEGDAHKGKTVKHRTLIRKHPMQPNIRQVHLLPLEFLEELKATGFTVDIGTLGENITTRGIDMLAIPLATKLHIGNEVVLEVTGARNPCRQLDMLEPGLLKACIDRDEDGGLIRKAGIMTIVLEGGIVRPEDEIRVAFPPPPYLPLPRL